MDYLKTYKRFINSHYLNEGIRMTAGILLPALVLSYFNMLSTGIVLSVGALCVCATDAAGPILHRRIAMSVCNISILLVGLVIGFSTHSPFLLGLVLFVFSFFFSMLGVYGARAGSLGIASLLVMVLNMEHPREGWDVVWNALYMLAGGTWYMLFSLALYSFRPYKLAQQALGDYIQSIGDYLRTRARFYEKDADIDATYRELLQQQTTVQEKQSLLSELLFKTRDIVKESTNTGRVLVMIFLDASDLFQSVMTSYQDYSTLHTLFDATPILQQFKLLALDLARELDEIELSVITGKPSAENTMLWNHVSDTKEKHNELRKTYMTPDNVEGFISLQRILDNIEDMADRVRTLHRYTTYDRKINKRPDHDIDYEKLISHQDITPAIFINNITFRSNIFRHSLRVAIAVLVGFILSRWFHIGHSYWILLTIIVILKPAYSLTKKRNTDRLIGTVCGLLMGVLILLTVKNNTALLVIMIILMTISYIFLRRQYLVSVLFMTPYVILFFHLLNPHNFQAVMTDRLIDTIIGSVIAFIASVFLVPAWEHSGIKTLMVNMLNGNSDYFNIVSKPYADEQPVPVNEHQEARKNALVALANLSDAFNRMLSEPKRKQKSAAQIHQFVVLNHMLASHIATLSYYIQLQVIPYRSPEFKTVSADIVQYLTNAVIILEGDKVETNTTSHKDSLRLLNDKANSLLQKRKEELQKGQLETSTRKKLVNLKSVVDQFNFIYKIVGDILKISSTIEVDE